MGFSHLSGSDHLALLETLARQRKFHRPALQKTCDIQIERCSADVPQLFYFLVIPTVNAWNLKIINLDNCKDVTLVMVSPSQNFYMRILSLES